MCAKRSKVVEDRIGQLPRDILICIIRFLPLKEAGRTSVLAKYWDGLWVFSAQLDFDALAVVKRFGDPYSYYSKRRLIRRERQKYFDWVAKVLRCNRAPTIDEFRIRFDLTLFSQKCVDEWLIYAFSRRVKRLDLHLSYCCTFPTRLLLDQNSCFMIRSLSLHGVQVTREDVDVFLCKFPFLEHLKLCVSKLHSVEICGSSLALKHLELLGSSPLNSIVVRDSCLVSLRIGKVSNLVVENVPKLVQIGISGTLIRDFKPRLSAYLSRLQVFSFRVYCDDYRQLKAIDLPEMTELKELNLSFFAARDESLIAFTSLVRSSPKLEKLVVQVEWVTFDQRLEREYEESPRHPLQHLKVVEFRGYCGGSSEDELITYLLENAVALENVTVDTRPLDSRPPSAIKITRKHARKLKKRRPSSLVKFVIL